jgi:hypothetical protein
MVMRRELKMHASEHIFIRCGVKLFGGSEVNAEVVEEILMIGFDEVAAFVFEAAGLDDKSTGERLGVNFKHGGNKIGKWKVESGKLKLKTKRKDVEERKEKSEKSKRRKKRVKRKSER